MKKNKSEIELLRYRIKRYRNMGNGAMCQLLNSRLKKLLYKQQHMHT
ncbi:MAG: hypothetical protein LIP08_12495 [Bacteroides sp.]|nr:hypothetical protein [Bacteroides sp.]